MLLPRKKCKYRLSILTLIFTCVHPYLFLLNMENWNIPLSLSATSEISRKECSAEFPLYWLIPVFQTGCRAGCSPAWPCVNPSLLSFFLTLSPATSSFLSSTYIRPSLSSRVTWKQKAGDRKCIIIPNSMCPTKGQAVVFCSLDRQLLCPYATNLAFIEEKKKYVVCCVTCTQNLVYVRHTRTSLLMCVLS